MDQIQFVPVGMDTKAGASTDACHRKGKGGLGVVRINRLENDLSLKQGAGTVEAGGWALFFEEGLRSRNSG